MTLPRATTVPKPRRILPTLPSTNPYSNIVNLQSSVGGSNLGDPTDYIGQLQSRISGDIKTAMDNSNVDIAGLLKRIKAQQSGWKPNIPNLPPIQFRPGTGSAPTGNVKLNGGVDQWIAQAYRILGIPLTAKALADERYMIQHESGGRPGARNTTAAGLRAGLPQGLEQVVGGTFNAYHLPGYNDVFNPVHNILASLRYRKGRYKTYDIGMYKGGY